MQGVYTKRSIKPVYDQRGEIASYKPNPTNDYKVYYILWSKKAVEEILSKSAPVNKDNIVYTIKFASEDCTFGNRMATRDQFSYEQFATPKWEEVHKWHVKPTVKAAMEFIDKNKTGYNLTYEPS
jgi:hypothetical protein